MSYFKQKYKYVNKVRQYSHVKKGPIRKLLRLIWDINTVQDISNKNYKKKKMLI